jgi:hypothetical protein
LLILIVFKGEQWLLMVHHDILGEPESHDVAACLNPKPPSISWSETNKLEIL